MGAGTPEFDALVEDAAKKTRGLADDVIAEATKLEMPVGDYAVAVLAASFRQAAANMQAESIEEARSGRDGKWDQEWFVYCKEKGDVLYKSEAAAKEGGRYWLEHSAHPESVSVYVREVKRYEQEMLDRSGWADA